MPLHGKNLIGHALGAQGERTFQAVDPATGEKLGTSFHDATPAEADRALELAEGAFRSRPMPEPAQTATLLERIADEIEALGDELIERGSAETALPAARLTGERGRTTGQLRLFAQVVREGSWVDARIDRAQPDRRPVPKPDLRRMLVPLGPVVVFPASNFPLAFSVAGGDTASALAAGCPVIVKARPSHPGTSELVGQAVQKAMIETGMPDGSFSMLHGAGREMGVYLVRHPAVRAVGFTGSLQGGRALHDAAASRPDPIPVYAEMGSINPVFLLPGALAERGEAIAKGLYQSVTLGVGQFCTNPGLVLAIKGEPLDRFLDVLGTLIKETPPGTMLMEPIRRAYQEGIERLLGASGVRRQAHPRQIADPAKTQCRAALFTTEAQVFLRNPDLRHEVFGPATLVVRCAGPEEMLQIAESLEGQLTGTIHATESELAAQGPLRAVLQRKVGRLVFNGFPTGVEVCAAMNHGGPYPATTDAHFTSVGTAAMARFARPICFQASFDSQLPPELRNKNVRGIWRLVDNVLTKDDLG